MRTNFDNFLTYGPEPYCPSDCPRLRDEDFEGECDECIYDELKADEDLAEAERRWESKRDREL